MTSRADLELTARVRRALDGALGARAIHISVVRSFVRLLGRVPNQLERDRAAAAAAGVSGVRAVQNGLEVR